MLPFAPTGKTVRIVAATTANSAVRLNDFDGNLSQSSQLRIRNNGTVDVVMGWGSTEAEAVSAAAWPNTPGTKSIVVGPGAVEVFTFDIRQYFAVLAASGTANVDITPGDGP